MDETYWSVAAAHRIQIKRDKDVFDSRLQICKDALEATDRISIDVLQPVDATAFFVHIRHVGGAALEAL